MLKKTICVFAILHILSSIVLGIEVKTAAQNSPPKFMYVNGKIEGVCVDVMRAIEALDPDIKFVGDQQFIPGVIQYELR